MSGEPRQDAWEECEDTDWIQRLVEYAEGFIPEESQPVLHRLSGRAAGERAILRREVERLRAASPPITGGRVTISIEEYTALMQVSENYRALRGGTPAGETTPAVRQITDALTGITPYVKHDTNCPTRNADADCICGANNALQALQASVAALRGASQPGAPTPGLELMRQAIREQVGMVAADGSTSSIAVMHLTAMLERLYELRGRAEPEGGRRTQETMDAIKSAALGLFKSGDGPAFEASVRAALRDAPSVPRENEDE